jgi:hypothetical protein
MFIWYISSGFGVIYQEKSGNPVGATYLLEVEIGITDGTAVVELTMYAYKSQNIKSSTVTVLVRLSRLTVCHRCMYIGLQGPEFKLGRLASFYLGVKF